MNSKAFVCMALGLAGCVTPAVKTDFRNSAVVARPEAQVWADLIGYFTSHQIQIRTIERDSGVIYAERALFDPVFASCDHDPTLTEISGTVTMNVFVRPLSPNQTQVTVNADFHQIGTLGRTDYNLDCFSTGVLEAQILRAVGATVTVTPSPASEQGR